MRLKPEDILYEDHQIFVYHKQSGLATQTAKLGEQDAVSLIKNYLKTPYIAVIHRLDQPVEGVLVFAKTKEAAAALNAQDMEKRYYAVVLGDLSHPDFQLAKGSNQETTLVDYLLKNGKDNFSLVTDKGTKDAKRAQLCYSIKKVLKQSTNDGKVLGLAEICLKTGRHHQIRVQMAHAGLPLIGDRKYGNENTLRISREMGIDDIALCAYSLTLLHPLSKKKVNFCIYPKGKAFLPFLPINPSNNT